MRRALLGAGRVRCWSHRRSSSRVCGNGPASWRGRMVDAERPHNGLAGRQSGPEIRSGNVAVAETGVALPVSPVGPASRASPQRPRSSVRAPSSSRISTATSRLFARRWARPWRARFARPSDGPNGVTTASGMVFGSTDQSTFALDARTGTCGPADTAHHDHEPDHDCAGGCERQAGAQPSSTGMAPGGRGILFGLDATTGRVRWRFGTILSPWRHPQVARGGGAWHTGPSTPKAMSTGARRIPTPGVDAAASERWRLPPATSSTPALPCRPLGRTGSLRWADQVTPHDIRDYDFQLPPILALVGGRAVVVGGGKAGRVIAWDRRDPSPSLGDEGWPATERRRAASCHAPERLPRSAGRCRNADGALRRTRLCSGRRPLLSPE